MNGDHTVAVTLADRPDFVPVVADWVWEAFDRNDGYTHEETRAMIAASTARLGAPQAFILLDRDEPVATASLLAEDAPERPDLTPWLAGVFVRPEARGRGFAKRLVGTVEDAARAAGVQTLWLYTPSAEGLYAGIGWRRVGPFDRGGHEVMLMSRDLR